MVYKSPQTIPNMDEFKVGERGRVSYVRTMNDSKNDYPFALTASGPMYSVQGDLTPDQCNRKLYNRSLSFI